MDSEKGVRKHRLKAPVWLKNSCTWDTQREYDGKVRDLRVLYPSLSCNRDFLEGMVSLVITKSNIRPGERAADVEQREETS